MEYKIYCKDNDTYLDVQKYAFKLGYSWRCNGKQISNQHHSFIFLNKNFTMTESNSHKIYNETITHQEITLEELKEMVIQPKDFKIKCKDDNEFIQAQKYAFELGYYWISCVDKKCIYRGYTHLYLKEKLNKYLQYSNNISSFNADLSKEITIEQLKEMVENRLEKTEFIVDDIVEINSNYKREDDNKKESIDKLLNYFGRAY